MNNKILIIDRETDVLQILETLLTTKGYQVKTATSGEEAIDFIKSEIFHLVIMDIRMPDVDGLEFIRQLKNLDDEIEVIVLTGFVSIENAVRALRDNGAVDFIPKPLENIDQLIISIEKALRERSIHQEVKALVKELKLPSKEMSLRIKKIVDKLSRADDQVMSRSIEHKHAGESNGNHRE